MIDAKSDENALIRDIFEEADVLDTEVIGNAEIIGKFERDVPALSCAIFPESQLAAIGWSDGVIEIRNTETLDEVCRLDKRKELPATFLTGYTSNDAKELLLASYASGETVMWDAEEGQAIWSFQEDRQALVNDIDNDQSSFAVGGSDAKISLYDMEKQKMMQMFQGSMDPEVMDGHNMRVFSVRFHPTRKHEILSGGWDDTVQFWDVREQFSRRKIRGPHICGSGIEFFEDNKIITASWTKRDPLQIWDYGSGRLIENIRPDDRKCFLYFCRYVDAESILLTGGSHKNMLRVIDTNTFKTSTTFQNLQGAVYFAKELPKNDPFSFSQNICFCSGTTIYVARIEV